MRRQSRDINRNIKRLVYCRYGTLVKSSVSSIGPSSERKVYYMSCDKCGASSRSMFTTRNVCIQL